MIQRYVERYPYDAETIEAIQFQDKDEILLEIANWFAENGIENVRISYEDVMETRLILEHKRGNFSALSGWYIVKNKDGSFCAYEESAFHNTFVLQSV